VVVGTRGIVVVGSGVSVLVGMSPRGTVLAFGTAEVDAGADDDALELVLGDSVTVTVDTLVTVVVLGAAAVSPPEPITPPIPHDSSSANSPRMMAPMMSSGFLPPPDDPPDGGCPPVGG
jgi:hypothetical protein